MESDQDVDELKEEHEKEEEENKGQIRRGRIITRTRVIAIK